MNNITLISLHSQKGGTGKTSIALNLALWAKANGKNPLFIDADLSGTSVSDSLHFKVPVEPFQNIEDYFLEVGVKREPSEYFAHASVTDRLSQVEHTIPVLLGKSQSAQILMPLVYKENHTNYLRMRLENLINSARKHFQIDTIVIDNSPGTWGLSQATKAIIDRGELEINSDVKFHGRSILVSSADLNDVISCLNLLAKPAKKKYFYILNRTPYGSDPAANTEQLAARLEQKAGALSFWPQYIQYATEIRTGYVKWAAEENLDIKNLYTNHVTGFTPLPQIENLANQIWNTPHE